MGAPLPAGTTPTAQRDWGEYFRTHAREVAYGATAVAVIGVAVWLYVTSEARKQAFAAQALSAGARGVGGGEPAARGQRPQQAGGPLRRDAGRGRRRGAAQRRAAPHGEDRRRGAGPPEVRREGPPQGHPRLRPGRSWAAAWRASGSSRTPRTRTGRRRRSRRTTSSGRRACSTRGACWRSRATRRAPARPTARCSQKYGKLSQAAEARVRMGEVGGTVPATRPKSGPGSQG